MKLRLRLTFILIPFLLACASKPVKHVGKESKDAFHKVKKEL